MANTKSSAIMMIIFGFVFLHSMRVNRKTLKMFHAKNLFMFIFKINETKSVLYKLTFIYEIVKFNY